MYVVCLRMKGGRYYSEQCLHAVVSSDASQNRQRTHETAEDELIISIVMKEAEKCYTAKLIQSM